MNNDDDDSTAAVGKVVDYHARRMEVDEGIY